MEECGFLLGAVKVKYSVCCVVSVALLSGLSCKEKPKASDAGEAKEKSVVEKVGEVVKEAVTGKPAASLSAEERAAKLGFSQYLPKDTEMVFSVYNAKQAGEQLKALKLFGIIENNIGMADRLVPDDLEMEEEMLEDENVVPPDAEQGPEDVELEQEGMEAAASPWTLFGQEVTMGFGKTSANQTGHLLTLNRRMGFFQAKAFGRAAQSYAKSGNMDDFTSSIVEDMGGEGLLKSLLEDSESGTALLEKAVMPPMYFAFRAKEGELEQTAQLLNSGMTVFAMAGEMVEPVTFERAGSEFSGYKLMGEKFAELLKAERESMDEKLGAELVDALISAIGKKNLFFVTGTIGNYAVMMISGTEESLTLASSAEESILANEKMSFADAFAEKQMLAFAYGDKEALNILVNEAGGIAPFALGFRDGISGGEGLGDTRDLEGMLQIIADREKGLLTLGRSEDWGMIAYNEDGLKIENFGGYDNGAVDWEADTTLAHLGDSGDNLLFMSAASNGTYEDKMLEYAEAIVETAYAATVKFSALEVDAPELAEMKQFTKLFDEQFREDAVGLYAAIGGSFTEGLGDESAIVIDLKGSVPAIPGLPQEVVDEGKAPRITMIAPVTNRAKLSSSWAEINTHATSILGKVSEMTEEKIPMQKPMSSEKDDMITWFFPFPFFQDDFLPSVTLNDKWFAASTSKTQAIDLINKAEAGGESAKGIRFYVNFNALTQYADQMLAVVDKNSAAIFTNEDDLADFNQNKVEIKEVIDACSEFDSLTWSSAKEDGTIHSTIHFKTK